MDGECGGARARKLALEYVKEGVGSLRCATEWGTILLNDEGVIRIGVEGEREKMSRTKGGDTFCKK
jgi:hypothetical protein